MWTRVSFVKCCVVFPWQLWRVTIQTSSHKMHRESLAHPVPLMVWSYVSAYWCCCLLMGFTMHLEWVKMFSCPALGVSLSNWMGLDCSSGGHEVGCRKIILAEPDGLCSEECHGGREGQVSPSLTQTSNPKSGTHGTADFPFNLFISTPAPPPPTHTHTHAHTHTPPPFLLWCFSLPACIPSSSVLSWPVVSP